MIRRVTARCAALTLLLMPVCAWAQSALVQEVDVLESGASAEDAKAKALAKGELTAIQAAAAAARPEYPAPALTAAQTAPVIESFEILSEKIGPKRYTAKVRYTLNEQRLYVLLDQTAAAVVSVPAEGSGKPSTPVAGSGRVLLLVPVGTLQEWLQVKARLESSSFVSGVTLMAFSLQQADVALDYRGEPQAVVADLRKQGLDVTAEAEYWVAKSMGGNP